MDKRLELTDNEYFQLEAYEWKKKELGYERTITKLQKELTNKDIGLLSYSIADKRRKMQELDDKSVQLGITIENVDVEKLKVIERINDRLDIDVADWGYNPDTLEIIF